MSGRAQCSAGRWDPVMRTPKFLAELGRPNGRTRGNAIRARHPAIAQNANARRSVRNKSDARG
eukprot:15439458-Alexandrium_andersonii.AAC.1